ncbi:hypothetical protein HDC90_004125 [Pedobacter sp. AK013]|uniref:hypothetical protein n=1 Tax=Pedobacter sp. AK013 TaxID=2723071 RepID=UPI00161221D3|nr:hypothetical protein [Pedobacter sp. AK013]MBB6239472.1 hypothetical protein [Pedobacter sp. AK013]
MINIIDFLRHTALGLPRLTAAYRLLLFVVKKNQKPPAENFSFKVSEMAFSVKPEKFIRPDLSRTEGCALA